MENLSHISDPPSATQEVIETAKERAQQVKATVTEEAGRAVESIKTAAIEQAERGKSELAESLKSVDEALRKTSSGMENATLAPQVERMADVISQAQQFVETHRIEDLGTAVRRLSLQHPAVFYAGIFALGFVAGRFLSSTENRTLEQQELEINLLDAAPRVDVEYQPEPQQVVSHHGSY